MTFQQAICKLQDLAVEGSPALVPAVEILVSIPRHSIYSMINGEKLPAVKICGSWFSEKEIFTEFFRRTLRPEKLAKELPIVGFKESRKTQIEEAIAQVKGSRR